MAVLEMVQDLADHAGVGDERNDAHHAAALFANQRVGLDKRLPEQGPQTFSKRPHLRGRPFERPPLWGKDELLLNLHYARTIFTM